MRQIAFTSLLCLLLTCCGKKQTTDHAVKSDGNTVLTTFYPLQYFAERIGGAHLSIECPVPDGADPIFWRPDRAALGRFQSADLILINGADFEKWIATASLPENRIVNTTKSFEQDFIKFEVDISHRHGPEGEEHTHSGIDGHTWVDPNNAKLQAAAIHQAFSKKWPEHAADFEKNFQALAADLDGIDEALKSLKIEQPLLASHPAYNYVAHRYAWQIESFNIDPEVMPAKDAIPTDNTAKLILWESAPRERIAKLLDEKYGIKGVVFSPVETKGDLDYIAAMKANIERLKAALD